MIDYYNAFISYKHAPLDIKVAEHVQAQLEHFHIPGRIRNKTGKKRIQRIFRDKEELPITSDLSETIERALENSDFLIVICSHSTCQSQWVKREIQLFLKNHTRDQILTVLAEGEPSEVIPEELLKDEKPELQPDGSIKLVVHEKEPLSCDYRMPFKKADKEELPRLAAAIIGCSYDELMNRRRQYQMQRIGVLGIILASLALGFSGYMFYSRMRVQRAYQESLRNQSIYLANESRKLLENEQRIEAIQLALAALPSENDERPITAEAVRALTDATLAYMPLSGSSIESVWNYVVSERIRSMTISDDHNTLACSDYSETVTVWNTESHETIIQKTFPKQNVLQIVFANDETLIVLTNTTVYSFDVSKKKELWNYEMKKSGYRNVAPICTSDGESFYLLDLDNTFWHFAAESGDVLDKLSIPKMEDNTYPIYGDFVLSPNDRTIAFVSQIYDGENASIGVIDVKTGDAEFASITSPDVRNIMWVDNDRIAVCGYDIMDSKNMINGDSRILEPNNCRITLFRFDDTLKEVWSSDFIFHEFRAANGFLYMESNDTLAYYCGDVMKIYDCASGEVKNTYDTNRTIVHINDNDGDGLPVFITEDGALGSPLMSAGPDTISFSFELVNNIDMVLVGGGVYVLRTNESKIYYYDVFVSDEEWEELDEDVLIAMPDLDYFLDDDYLVCSYPLDMSTHIVAYDLADESLLWDITLEDVYSSSCTVLGVREDTLYVLCQYHVDFSCTYLLSLSMEDGEEIDSQVLTYYIGRIESAVSFEGEYLTYIYKRNGGKINQIGLLNILTGDEEYYDLPFNTCNAKCAPVYFPQANAIYYADQDEGEYIIDAESGDWVEVDLPDEWSGTNIVEVNTAGDKWVIADTNQILFVDGDGEVEQELNCVGRQAIGIMFWKEKKTEQMLVVFMDGTMYRYDASDGKFLGSLSVETYELENLPATMIMDEKNHTLFIQTGFITDVIDIDSWYEVAVVQNSLGYHAPSDQFFAYSYETSYKCRIGKFRHYTLSDLINKAHNILGGAELREDQKARYGIS
ncbi:MAG: toll/interleukin-1 receptor domain-containing protein [Clostridiales bacterium]|nr:toll/interleukin-1 receptor domain-containing protein [Clostridiales bacterium]